MYVLIFIIKIYLDPWHKMGSKQWQKNKINANTKKISVGSSLNIGISPEFHNRCITSQKMYSLLAERKLKCIYTKNNKTDNKQKNFTNFLK